MWWVAHAVLYLRHVKQPQDTFTIHENMLLVEADTEHEALEKGTRRARLIEDKFEGPECGTYEDGQPAEWVFAGVRKLNPVEDYQERPTDGIEVAFSSYSTSDFSVVTAMAEGLNVKIDYNY